MPESIKVTLELDDRIYTAKLQSAIDDTKKLGTESQIASDKAISGFNKLSASADLALTKIKGLLVAFAGFEAIRGALAFGDQLSDLSKATDISIQKIIALQGALQSAGGNGEDAGRMIQALINNLDGAAQGSADAQYQLLKLGFSFKDMTNLSPEQALEKTIAALAKMTNPIERNALAFQLLGKSARGINWEEVNQKLDENASKYDAAAEAAKKAGEVFDRLEAAGKNAKIGLMIAIEPLNDLIDLLGKLAGGPSGGFVQALAFTFKALAIGVATIASAFKGIIIDIKTLIDLGPAIWARDWDRAGKIIENRNKEVAKTFEDLAQYVNNQDLFNTQGGAGAGRGKINPPLVKPAAGGGGTVAAAPNAMAGQISAINQLAEAYQIANARAREKMQMDYELAGSSDEYKKITEETARITNEAADKINNLRDRLKNLTPQQRAFGLGKAIQDAIKAIEDERDTSIAAATAVISKNEERIRGINELKAAYEAMSQAQLAGTEQFLAGQQKIKDVEAARQQALMGPLAKALDQIRIEEEKLADAARKRELATGRYTNAEGEITQASALAEAYRRIGDEQAKNTTRRQEQATQIFQEQNSFAYGWNDAFKKYVEGVTNAADTARSIFSSVTKGMEDALVKFATTGKLSFKDLANSIIADLARIYAKQLIVGLFGKPAEGGTATGGVLSGLFNSFLGLFKAEGGPVSANKPYVVGERGAELFIPRNSGQVIPNRQLSLAGAEPSNTYVTYNIQAVDASSFRQLVARDPSFIYAVTEQGRRSQPSRR